MHISDRNFIFEKVFADGMELSVGRVFQIAELSVVRGGVVPEHKQVCDEITYVISGSATVYADGEEMKLSKGQVHYITKDCLHTILAGHTENFRYICLGFTAKETEELSEFLQTVRQKKSVVLEDDSTVKKLSELIVNEFYGWDGYSAGMVSHYLTQILISVCRLMRGVVSGPVSGGAVPAGMTVYRVIRHIDREFSCIRRVKEIAEALSYNDCYLSHLFREQTGMTVKEYLMYRKMEEAKRVLSEGKDAVEHIAESLGFPSAHTFRRAFKEYAGVSPTDYRKGATAKNGR